MTDPRVPYAAPDPELKALFRLHKASDDEVESMCRNLHAQGICTVQHFLGYFDMLPILSFWQGVAEWNPPDGQNPKGAILSYLRSAHRTVIDQESELKDKEKETKSSLSLSLNI